MTLHIISNMLRYIRTSLLHLLLSLLHLLLFLFIQCVHMWRVEEMLEKDNKISRYVLCHQTCAYVFASAYNSIALQMEWMNEQANERLDAPRVLYAMHIHKRTHGVIWMVFGSSFHFRFHFHFSMCTSLPPPTSSHTSIYSNQPYAVSHRFDVAVVDVVMCCFNWAWNGLWGCGWFGCVSFVFVPCSYHTFANWCIVCLCLCLPANLPTWLPACITYTVFV